MDEDEVFLPPCLVVWSDAIFKGVLYFLSSDP